MTELEALQARRELLLEKISMAAAEIERIDERLSFLLEGNKGQGEAV